MAEHEFVIVITRETDEPRSVARETVLSILDERFTNSHSSWRDASIDTPDPEPDSIALLVLPHQWADASRKLAEHSLIPIEGVAVGAHPSVQMYANEGDNVPMGFVCDRCDETAETLDDLFLVPCADLTVADHAHYWAANHGEGEGSVGCAGCDMVVFGEGERVTHPTYEVLDQRGIAIGRFDSWGVASTVAGHYGPMASIYDHEERKLQKVGVMPDI